jgi:putative modified peptide
MPGTKLEPALVDKLLDKLGTDDQFRSAFAKDPKSALQSIGAPSTVECGGCMSPKKLASKEQFQKSRGKFRDAMLGQSSHQVFNLEA